MKTARIFTNGRSQAVRLPKEFRFKGKEVYIKSVQGLIVLIPKNGPWVSLLGSLDRFSEDFLEDRGQPPAQERDNL